MPIEIRPDDGYLRIVFFGTLTNADLVSGALELRAIERASAVVPPRLSLLGDVERLEVDFGGIRALAQDRSGRDYANPFKSAIVAADVVTFGFARMYQTLTVHPQIATAIFRDEALALAWLRVPGQALPTGVWDTQIERRA